METQKIPNSQNNLEKEEQKTRKKLKQNPPLWAQVPGKEQSKQERKFLDNNLFIPDKHYRKIPTAPPYTTPSKSKWNPRILPSWSYNKVPQTPAHVVSENA